MKRKNLDYIIANSPENFENITGEIKLLSKDNQILEIKGTKEEIAKKGFIKHF